MKSMLLSRNKFIIIRIYYYYYNYHHYHYHYHYYDYLTRLFAFLPNPSSPASNAFFMECGGLGSPYGTTCEGERE